MQTGIEVEIPANTPSFSMKPSSFKKKGRAVERQPKNDSQVRFLDEGCATYLRALDGSSVPKATDFVAREIASLGQKN